MIEGVEKLIGLQESLDDEQLLTVSADNGIINRSKILFAFFSQGTY
jgi:hypothetical protein